MKKYIRFSLLIGLLLSLALVFPSTAQDVPAEGEGELLTPFEGYLEAFNTSNVEALPQYLTEDHLRHQLMGPTVETGELIELPGIEAIAGMITGFHNDMPGVEFFVNYSVERDGFLWVSGSSTELPDTDGVVINFVLLSRWEDGKIAEIWVADDEIAMLSLLDVLPTPMEE